MRMYQHITSWILLPLLSGMCGGRISPIVEDCPVSVDPRVFLSDLELDQGLPYRAFQSVPKGFRITRSSIPGAGLGVISEIFLPRHMWLGEYQGLILQGNESSYAVCVEQSYIWEVHNIRGYPYYLDASKIGWSNWLRFINCPRWPQEWNVQSTRCLGKIYYRTLKDIAPGTELLVYYGDSYAEQLGIDTTLFTTRCY